MMEKDFYKNFKNLKPTQKKTVNKKEDAKRYKIKWLWKIYCSVLSICVCVCAWESERDREGLGIPYMFQLTWWCMPMLVDIMIYFFVVELEKRKSMLKLNSLCSTGFRTKKYRFTLRIINMKYLSEFHYLKWNLFEGRAQTYYHKKLLIFICNKYCKLVVDIHAW